MFQNVWYHFDVFLYFTCIASPDGLNRDKPVRKRRHLNSIDIVFTTISSCIYHTFRGPLVGRL